MKASLVEKLERLAARHENVAALLADPDTIADQNEFRKLSMEYSQNEQLVRQFNEYQQAEAGKTAALEMLADPDMAELAKEEISDCEQRMETLAADLQKSLIPIDPHDQSNIFLEIRAGTGGDEAAIFAGDLLRMYTRFTENQGWRLEILSENEGEHGGYKEVIARVIGSGVYSKLKFESGAHRVQRVPETESQGRVHTSAATVAILPEVDEVEGIEIHSADLRIDTYRASGAGGQHVNKTDSAVRLTHLPTGVVVECQDERSQHKNRARAMSLLKARLLDAERSKQQAAQTESRRLQVGSGDRSERIRTYNFPQGRMTDHRINLTLYKLEEIMGGGLSQVIEPLLSEHQAEELAAMEHQ